MPSNPAQVCLIHGQDVEAMNKVRDRTLNSLLPPELRAEHLTDYMSSSNRALRLMDIGWDLISELSTLSFFPDVRRVAIVTDLRDFCEAAGGSRRKPTARKGKAAAKAPVKTDKKAMVMERFCGFLTNGLLQTPNAIIFINYEKDMDTTVARQSPLYQAVQAVGWVQECKGENKTFAFEDALRGRDAIRAVGLYRELKKSAPPSMIFHTLVRLTRALLQAKVVTIKRKEGLSDARLQELLPSDRSGFFQQHTFVQKKNLEGARQFNASELTGALKELLEINRLVIPVSTDVYVRDLSLSIEMWIARWFARPRRTARG